MKRCLMLLSLLSVLTLNVFSQPLKPGDKAPEIEQVLVSGEDFQLSELRGTLVLVDFWAAWCKPCRKENPELVKLYHKYKDESFENAEGFTIVSVSMDFKREMWENAIAKDELAWPYHVGDMKGWKTEAARMYNVKSIPTSFLIDGDGKIIGTYLRGEAIEEAIKKARKRKSFFFSLKN
ncbi:MAG: TlpA disulfide reductase family protein [Bacteroidales bacterium]